MTGGFFGPDTASGATGDPSGGVGSPASVTGATGDPSGGSPADPTGATGSSSGQPTDPPVNKDNVLGSWDNRFLHGTDGSWGNSGLMPDTGIQGLIGDLTSLIRDLTNILGSLGGPWTPDGNNGSGMGLPGDWSGHGSAGGLDDGGNHHHHHDLWKPGQH